MLPDTSTPDAPPDVPPDASAPLCPDGHLCLEPHPVRPGLTIPSGRLGIVFYPFNDQIDVQPFIALDLPFDLQTPQIQIPLASVLEPAPLDHYWLCSRKCDALEDPACACLPETPKAAIAYVVVALDANGSGTLELDELDAGTTFGVGDALLASADHDYPVPNVLESVFPKGIVYGLNPYRINNSLPFDQLVLPTPGAVFDLDLCVPGDVGTCSLVRSPNVN